MSKSWPVPSLGTSVVNAEIGAINRNRDGVVIHDRQYGAERFDDVVIAAHADQALALLADPSDEERSLLGSFRYSRNEASFTPT